MRADALVAVGLNNEAWAMHLLRDDEAASAVAERAARLFEEVLGPEHVALAHALDTLALCVAGRGDHERARALETRGIAIIEKASGKDSPDLRPLLVGLGEACIGIGDHAAARLNLERALTGFGSEGAPTGSLGGRARFALARVLVDERTELPRAQRLALDAQGDFARVGADDERRKVERWLAETPSMVSLGRGR
jgi:hypothetical protein